MDAEQRLRDVVSKHGLTPAGCTIATNYEMGKNQVVMIADIRYVVRRQITAEEFGERTARNAQLRAQQAREYGIPELLPGQLLMTVEGAKASEVHDAPEGPPPDAKYFYVVEPV